MTLSLNETNRLTALNAIPADQRTPAQNQELAALTAKHNQ